MRHCRACVADGVLPTSVIDAARTELRQLLETPEVAGAGKQRARLTTKLEHLKKQHQLGDLTDAEYQVHRHATNADLAELLDGDRIRTFDAYRARVLELPWAIEAASLTKREELCRVVVQRVVVRNRPSSPGSSGYPPPGPSSNGSGSAPKGIRTPDLHLERVAS